MKDESPSLPGRRFGHRPSHRYPFRQRRCSRDHQRHKPRSRRGYHCGYGRCAERAYAHQADVSDSAAVRAMFAEVNRRFGGLDILMNNAGIGETDGRGDYVNQTAEAQLRELKASGRVQSHWDVTSSLTDEEWRRMIDVHLGGTFFCTREALKLMAVKNRGSIINMSSVAGLSGIPIASHYGAAKGGILGFTRSVALEVASRNIRVNAICPGWVETPMTQNFTPVLNMALVSRVPMLRWGQPEEIAATALFLASDDSSYYTVSGSPLTAASSPAERAEWSQRPLPGSGKK